MKISKLWISKFIDKKLSNNKLIYLLNKSSLEIKKINILKKNIEKVISGKIINVFKKKNYFIIELYFGKKYNNLIIKQKLYNIDITNINNIITPVIFFKKNNINNNQKIFIYSKYILNINNNKDLVFLNKNIKLGIDLIKFLNLNDTIIDLLIPNNRIDCLNLLGIIEEISINYKFNICLPKNILKVSLEKKDFFSIYINNNNICKKYSGIIIKNIKINYIPEYIKDRLLDNDLNINNNIIDIINYIFLETGYIINIFNIKDIYNNKIFIKLTEKDEYNLINNINTMIYKNTLIICNSDNKILYIPGLNNYLIYKFNINTTYNIFVGSGSFNNNFINLNRNNYVNYFNPNNEIEKDNNLINYVLEYFINILSNISKNIMYSGIIEKKCRYRNSKYIILNLNKFYKFLGFKINYKNIINIIKKLKFIFIINKKNKYILNIKIPKHRLDLNSKEDLFEEIIRIYGYNKIPTSSYFKNNILNNILYTNNNNNIHNKIKNFLINKGYNEIISYSFINKKIQSNIYNNTNQINIINPISENMSSMRKSLIFGLINTIIFNENRQKENMKLFELGLCFNIYNNNIIQQRFLSGVNYGYKKDDFFKIKINSKFDFYDMKGDVEEILLFFQNKNYFLFKKNNDNNLFDLSKSISIFDKKEKYNIGYFGYINNNIRKIFKLKKEIIFFEICLDKLKNNILKINLNDIYKYKINKRDISITINNNINNIYEILNYLYNLKNKYILKIKLIDIYKDKNISNIFNNFTIRFYILNKNKNLTIERINIIINYYIIKIKNKFNIIIKNNE